MISIHFLILEIKKVGFIMNTFVKIEYIYFFCMEYIAICILQFKNCVHGLRQPALFNAKLKPADQL